MCCYKVRWLLNGVVITAVDTKGSTVVLGNSVRCTYNVLHFVSLLWSVFIMKPSSFTTSLQEPGAITLNQPAIVVTHTRVCYAYVVYLYSVNVHVQYTYMYMFRVFCQFTQFVNCTTQFGNCQNARAIFKLRFFFCEICKLRKYRYSIYQF